jgi:hypothetical protein
MTPEERKKIRHSEAFIAHMMLRAYLAENEKRKERTYAEIGALNDALDRIDQENARAHVMLSQYLEPAAEPVTAEVFTVTGNGAALEPSGVFPAETFIAEGATIDSEGDLVPLASVVPDQGWPEPAPIDPLELLRDWFDSQQPVRGYVFENGDDEPIDARAGIGALPQHDFATCRSCGSHLLWRPDGSLVCIRYGHQIGISDDGSLTFALPPKAC